MFTFDSTDLKILDLLQHNSEYTIKEISEHIHLSTTTVFERVKELEKEGLIRRYVAVLSPEKLNKELFAFVHISLKEHGKKQVEAFVNQVVEFPEVMECHHVSGEEDFILKVLTESIKEYNTFVLEKLSAVNNISKVVSRFSLSVCKHTTAIPLPVLH